MTKEEEQKLDQIVQFRMDKESYEKLKLEAKDDCRSFSRHIYWIITNHLKND